MSRGRDQGLNPLGKVLAACALFALLAVDPSDAAASKYPVHQPVPGGIAVIEIGPDWGEGYEARFGSRPILVLQRNGAWLGVVGIGLDTALGNYLISVKTPDDMSSLGFYVKAHSYPFKEEFSTLGVPGELNPASSWRPGLDASFPLISPVEGTRVEQFGSRHAVGNAAESVNWAVMSDIRSKDVVAPGGGAVADVFNTDGINYFVTIDHGMGLYSCVGPIRNFVLEQGQPVKKGETLGALGIDTVRPHTLYWKVTLNGVAVNPELVSDQLGTPE